MVVSYDAVVYVYVVIRAYFTLDAEFWRYESVVCGHQPFIVAPWSVATRRSASKLFTDSVLWFFVHYVSGPVLWKGNSHATFTFSVHGHEAHCQSGIVWAAKSGLNRSSTNNTSSGGGGSSSSSSSSSRWTYILNVFIYKKFSQYAMIMD